MPCISDVRALKDDPEEQNRAAQAGGRVEIRATPGGRPPAAGSARWRSREVDPRVPDQAIGIDLANEKEPCAVMFRVSQEGISLRPGEDVLEHVADVRFLGKQPAQELAVRLLALDAAFFAAEMAVGVPALNSHVLVHLAA